MIALTDIAKPYEGVLTQADVVAIYKAMTLQQEDDYWVRDHVRIVAQKVRRFAEKQGSTHLTDEVRWFMVIVSALLAAEGQTVRFPSNGVYSRDDVMRLVEEQAEQDDKIDREEWEDPEGYRTYYHRERTGHSWGNLLPMVRLWAKASLYEVWAIYEAVRYAAESTMVENLISMVIEDGDGDEIGEATVREFKKQMEALSKRLLAEVKTS